MLIRTRDGSLTLDAAGVTFEPYVLHGKADRTLWRWSEVRRVALEDGGKKADREYLAFGLVGLLFRRPRTFVVVSTAERDVTFETKQPAHELRAAVRRVEDDVPAAVGKVLL